MGRLTFDAEFQRLVPQSGNCNTLRGEVLRAANTIDYRLYNDGDKVGSGNVSDQPEAKSVSKSQVSKGAGSYFDIFKVR